MTGIIAHILKSTLADLPWIERFGGLVSVATRPEIDQAIDGVSSFKSMQTYPVACGVNLENCWEGNKFKHFEPDSSKAAIAFFYDTSGLKLKSTDGPRNSRLTFTFNLKFLCWLNIKRLGEDITANGCMPSGRLVPFVWAKMYGEHSAVGLFGGGIEETMLQNIEVTEVDEIAKNPNMFEPFSFAKNGDKRGLFIYPYDYFGLNIRGQFTINRLCLPADFGVDWEPTTNECTTP